MRFKNVTTENRNLNQCSVETVKNTTLCKLHYADDTQLYLALKPGCSSSTDDAIAAMERCVNEIHTGDFWSILEPPLQFLSQQQQGAMALRVEIG